MSISRLNIERLLQRCKNWSDFKSELKTLDRKGKGDCFEALTRYYLQLHPKYATKRHPQFLHDSLAFGTYPMQVIP